MLRWCMGSVWVNKGGRWGRRSRRRRPMGNRWRRRIYWMMSGMIISCYRGWMGSS